MQRVNRRMFSRRALVGASSALLAAGGAAMALRGSGFGARMRVDTRTLRRGNDSEPDTLDPQLASAAYEFSILGDLFLGLMTEDAAANQIPGAAESYSVSEDGLTYTFRIRDHSWSDGVPVTADDFVYSFRRIMDPRTASEYASVLYPILNAEAVNAKRAPPEALGVRALDSHTIEIRFAVEVPYAAALLAHTCTYPVPRHVVEKHGEGWTRPGIMVSNGPYVLTEWIPNDHIVIEKNPRFYDAAHVSIERAIIHPTQDYAAALTRFRAGELDIDVDVPSQDIGWIRRHLPGAMHIAPYMLSEYVLFNVRAKPVDDLRVRKALSLAIDRETIAQRVMGAGETAAYAFVPPHMPDYPGTARLRFSKIGMEQRRAEAKTLLVEAGYGPGRPLAFDFNINNLTTARAVSVALQSMWKEIGAEVRIVPSDEKDHYNLLLNQEFSVAWAAWSADYLDAKNFLILYQSNARALNNGAYANPEFDRLFARSDHIADARARGECLAKAEQIMLDDAAIAPVFFGVTRTLVAPAVTGWVANVMNIHHTRWLALDRSRAAA